MPAEATESISVQDDVQINLQGGKKKHVNQDIDVNIRLNYFLMFIVFWKCFCFVSEHSKEKKRKGVKGFFKWTWKAVKRPFRHSRETRVEAIVPPLLPEAAVPCASGLQQTREAADVQHNAKSTRQGEMK